MSKHRLLQSKRRERIAFAYPGGHVRRPTAAYSHVHTTLASRLLPDQSVLRQGSYSSATSFDLVWSQPMIRVKRKKIIPTSQSHESSWCYFMHRELKGRLVTRRGEQRRERWRRPVGKSSTSSIIPSRNAANFTPWSIFINLRSSSLHQRNTL